MKAQEKMSFNIHLNSTINKNKKDYLSMKRPMLLIKYSGAQNEKVVSQDDRTSEYITFLYLLFFHWFQYKKFFLNPTPEQPTLSWPWEMHRNVRLMPTILRDCLYAMLKDMENLTISRNFLNSKGKQELWKSWE